MLPASVRAGITLAIAEPWAGSSYGGEFGEACGECWEVAALNGTQTVMVHDLCPIEGNPICAGSHFHFDVSTETAAALGLDGLDAAKAKRVPCPVVGNAFLQILDRNQWGYVRFQVLNQRIPIRNIEYRSATGADYFPAKRSGGAWSVGDVQDMFASGGEGGCFRLTSVQGEVLEMPSVMKYDVTQGSFFDLGAQVGTTAAVSSACQFSPPRDVYVDGYGGIDQVRWMMNPWSSASPSETTSDCVSGSCLKIAGLGSGAGFHIYYRQSFTPSLYKSLNFSHKSDASGSSFEVTLTGDGAECTSSKFNPSPAWKQETINLAAVCAGVGPINSVTVYGSTPLVLYLDDLQFGL